MSEATKESESKNNFSVEGYDFAEFTQVADDQDVIEYDFRDMEEVRLKEKESIQPRIRQEREYSKKEMFLVSPIVEHFRGLRDQEELEHERQVDEEVAQRVADLKEQAYKEGFEKGQEEGRNQIKNELSSEVELKLNQLQEMIEELTATRNHVLENEKRNIYEVVKSLTKWIILRELEEDGQYLERLLEKLIMELKSRSNLLLKVSKKHFEEIPEIMEKVEARVGAITNSRVEIIHDAEEENGMILECDNGIIDGRIETQIENLNNLFNELDVYGRDESGDGEEDNS